MDTEQDVTAPVVGDLVALTVPAVNGSAIFAPGTTGEYVSDNDNGAIVRVSGGWDDNAWAVRLYCIDASTLVLVTSGN